MHGHNKKEADPQALKLHPISSKRLPGNLEPLMPLPTGIWASAIRSQNRWQATFELENAFWPNQDALFAAPHGSSKRMDGLWEQTCAELFIAVSKDVAEDGYFEINLSPSSLWQAYRFAGIRRERHTAPGHLNRISVDVGKYGQKSILCADFELEDSFQALGPMGFAVVWRPRPEHSFYWALEHCDPECPDFHQPIAWTDQSLASV